MCQTKKVAALFVVACCAFVLSAMVSPALLQAGTSLGLEAARPGAPRGLAEAWWALEKEGAAGATTTPAEWGVALLGARTASALAQGLRAAGDLLTWLLGSSGGSGRGRSSTIAAHGFAHGAGLFSMLRRVYTATAALVVASHGPRSLRSVVWGAGCAFFWVVLPR